MEAFFKKYFKTYDLKEKWWNRLFLPRYFNGEIIINTRTHFYRNNFFELFCIENDFVEIL